MKRQIIFVDDEPMILQGLRRMLRGMRHEWDMVFALGGPEALEFMAKNPFDVIVSDMRMPDMDGAQLLDKVKKLYPYTVRIILSGHSEKEMIMKAVRPAHQYLSKPCDAGKLKSTIDRSCRVRDLLAQDNLKDLVSQIESLPSLPAIYKELVDMLQSSDGSIQKIGEVIARDMGMTAKILQLVNSAFFGVPRHISNPPQAVSLLGLDTVKALVLTIGIFSKFEKDRLLGLGVESLWDHSMKTGTIAKGVAEVEGVHKNQQDDALMAGLLHDVGKLILAANIPEKYGEVLEQARVQGVSPHEAEGQILGATHAEVGAYLVGLWGFPDTIVEAIAFHHSPEDCPAEGLTPLSIIHVANGLEHHFTQSSAGDGPVPGIDYAYLEKLGLIGRIPEWQKVCLRMKERREEND
ncbi:MAG: HDOD domain-containing protein [Deltaproteobacteria bacterium]|nr:HDOD domain-containing protein [Deltaproteobacteria bacterium]